VETHIATRAQRTDIGRRAHFRATHARRGQEAPYKHIIGLAHVGIVAGQRNHAGARLIVRATVGTRRAIRARKVNHARCWRRCAQFVRIIQSRAIAVEPRLVALRVGNARGALARTASGCDGIQRAR
jgi:hypothetical protein